MRRAQLRCGREGRAAEARDAGLTKSRQKLLRRQGQKIRDGRKLRVAFIRAVVLDDDAQSDSRGDRTHFDVRDETRHGRVDIRTALLIAAGEQRSYANPVTRAHQRLRADTAALVECDYREWQSRR